MGMVPPSLKTLRHRPTWINRAGRVDRYACFDLRASDIWRLVPTGDWRKAIRSPRAKTRLIARATITLCAAQLQRIRDARLPLALAGAHRTAKSNAAKVHPHQRTLALPDDWACKLTLERWRMHARLTQHFFQCPACGQAEGGNRQSKIDNRKSLKLFLITPTPDEWRDAQRAATFLSTHHDQLIRHQQFDLMTQLFDRYSALFPPRQLLCRTCLGIRYGEVKREVIHDERSHLTPDQWTQWIALDHAHRRLRLAKQRLEKMKQRYDELTGENNP